jgi:hypothetical protein
MWTTQSPVELLEVLAWFCYAAKGGYGVATARLRSVSFGVRL